MTAFKKYEAWWDEEEQNYKMQTVNVTVDAEKENKDKPEVKEEKKNITTETLLNSILDSNFDSVNYNSAAGGFGLGFRAALPKMPSFRVCYVLNIRASKFVKILLLIHVFFQLQSKLKVPSPVRLDEEDSRHSGIKNKDNDSDQDEMVKLSGRFLNNE